MQVVKPKTLHHVAAVELAAVPLATDVTAAIAVAAARGDHGLAADTKSTNC